MASLGYAAKFDPFPSLDCAGVEGVGDQILPSGNLETDNGGKIQISRLTDLLSDALDDALDVHLSEAEDEERAALLVLVVPAAGEVLLHHGRLLVL